MVPFVVVLLLIVETQCYLRLTAVKKSWGSFDGVSTDNRVDYSVSRKYADHCSNSENVQFSYEVL